MPLNEIVSRSRDDMADIDRFARFGVRHQAYIGFAMLQIKDLGKGMRRPTKCGMAGHIAHLLATHPD